MWTRTVFHIANINWFEPWMIGLDRNILNNFLINMFNPLLEYIGRQFADVLISKISRHEPNIFNTLDRVEVCNSNGIDLLCFFFRILFFLLFLCRQVISSILEHRIQRTHYSRAMNKYMSSDSILSEYRLIAYCVDLGINEVNLWMLTY